MTVTTLQRAPADFWEKWDSTGMTEATPRRVEADAVPGHEAPPRRQRSAGRRASRAFLRFMITLGLGVGGTLAWQAYGDDARDLLATAYPQRLGWIAPQPEATASAAQTTGAAPAPAVDQQQLNALALNIAAVRQSVEQLTAQVATGQQQMSGDIAKLQASEQDILTKIATPPPRPAPPARRLAPPPPATASAPTAPAPAAH